MADTDKSDASDSAEKAYAVAAEAVKEQPAGGAPVEFPAKAKREPKPNAAALPVPATARRPLARPVAKAKPVVKAPVPQASKPLSPRKPSPASLTTSKPTTIDKPEVSQLKDKTMDTQTTDFAAREAANGFKDVFTDVKAKAKAAFDKGTASIGDMTDFAKGNVEAVVESGKIYAAGLQEIGSTYVAESKTAFESLTADVKDLAAQKTPTDFFKLQGEIARKNFDNAIAFGSKSSEAWLKLANEAFAPISGRVSLAVEKVKAAA